MGVGATFAAVQGHFNAHLYRCGHGVHFLCPRYGSPTGPERLEVYAQGLSGVLKRECLSSCFAVECILQSITWLAYIYTAPAQLFAKKIMNYYQTCPKIYVTCPSNAGRFRHLRGYGKRCPLFPLLSGQTVPRRSSERGHGMEPSIRISVVESGDQGVGRGARLLYVIPA